MKHTLLIALTFITSIIYSQDQFNSEDFTVTKNDLKILAHANDSTAKALVIYEHGKSYVDKNTYKLKFSV